MPSSIQELITQHGLIPYKLVFLSAAAWYSELVALNIHCILNMKNSKRKILTKMNIFFIY